MEQWPLQHCACLGKLEECKICMYSVRFRVVVVFWGRFDLWGVGSAFINPINSSYSDVIRNIQLSEHIRACKQVAHSSRISIAFLSWLCASDAHQVSPHPQTSPRPHHRVHVPPIASFTVAMRHVLSCTCKNDVSIDALRFLVSSSDISSASTLRLQIQSQI